MLNSLQVFLNSNIIYKSDSSNNGSDEDFLDDVNTSLSRNLEIKHKSNVL